MMNMRSTYDSLLPTFGTMRHELQRALNESFHDERRVGGSSLCPISMWHDDQSLHIEADVPGLADAALDVTYEQGRLWIRGERKQTEGHSEYDFNERRFGSFERALLLPDWVDPSSINASLTDGVLYIHVAKKPDAQPRSIEIKHGGDSSVKKLDTESAE